MIQKIKPKLAEILEFVVKHPAIFFSEADIQAFFYEKLKTIDGLNKLYPTASSIGLNNKGELSKKTYETFAIHREYGVNKMPNSRVDIAIFNPDSISTITDPINLKNGKGEYLTPDYIFEFGTEKSAGSLSNLTKHLTNDIKKLEKANEMGFLVHIQRNYLLGKETKNNKAKHDNYVKAINKINIPNHIKILYFKVDIGGPKRHIQKAGKVNIYSNGELKGISQNELRDEINKRI